MSEVAAARGGREAQKEGAAGWGKSESPFQDHLPQRGLGKWAVGSQLLLNLFATLQLLAQCSSWLLPVPLWTSAHSRSPGRPGPISVRLPLGSSMRGRPYFPLLPPPPTPPVPAVQGCSCEVDIIAVWMVADRKHSELRGVWLFREPQKE